MTSAIRTLAVIVGVGGVIGIVQALGALATYVSTGMLQEMIESGAAATVFGWMALGVFFSGCSILLAILIFNAPKIEDRVQ